MIPKESEQIGSELPLISPKTPSERLQEFARKNWPSDGRNRVAGDIVKNGKELLAGTNTDWEIVLRSIRTRQLETALYGEAAIAVNGARFVGGLAARAGWSMHDPPIVYLSGKCLAHIAGSKLEDFKTTMTQTAVSYGQKTLPEAELLMKTLDLLLEDRDRRNHSNLVTKIAILFHDGKIQDAYSMVSSRENLVRRRG